MDEKNNDFYKVGNGSLKFNEEWPFLTPKGIPIPLVVQNGDSIDELIKGFFKNKSALIPKDANAYSVSDFSGDTQHLRNVDGKDKQFSVYAVQFYHFDVRG